MELDRGHDVDIWGGALARLVITGTTNYIHIVHKQLPDHLLALVLVLHLIHVMVHVILNQSVFDAVVDHLSDLVAI